jgi:hypothetical protein
VTAGEPRATHRRTRRLYKTRIPMPSKLDPHIAAIEGWLAERPQLTALAIVGRLSENHPKEFGKRQHSIVQRLLRALRRKTGEQLVAEEPLGDATTAAPLPGVVGGSGNVGPDCPQPFSSSNPGKPPGAADQGRSHRPVRWRHQVIRSCGNTQSQFWTPIPRPSRRFNSEVRFRASDKSRGATKSISRTSRMLTEIDRNSPSAGNGQTLHPGCSIGPKLVGVLSRSTFFL